MPAENIPSIDNRNGLASDVRVHRIQDLDFTREFLMPYHHSSEDEIFAQIVSHEDNPSRHVHSGWWTGRAGSIIPSFVFSRRNNPSVLFTDIYGKGIGMTNWEPAVAHYRGGDISLWDDKGKSTYFYGNNPDEAIGVAMLADSRLDAERSIQIDAVGIRSRLPIVVYQIDALKVKGEFVPVEKLRGTHFPLNPDSVPSISIWARRYPYNFQDLETYLSMAPATGNHGEKAARVVIDSIMTYLHFEKDNEAKLISKEYFDLKHKGYTGALLYLTELKLFHWMAKMYARQMNIMNAYGIYHDNLSIHQMSPLVEFSDNSHVMIYSQEDWIRHQGEHSKNREEAIGNINRFVTDIENARGSNAYLTTRNLYRTYVDEYERGRK